MKRLHGHVYGRMNEWSMRALRRWEPTWLTADGVTSFRLGLVVPCTALLTHDWAWTAGGLVLVNAGLDYVDGAVARWEKTRRDAPRVPGQTARRRALDATWGAYYDALADKLFALPVWVALAASRPDHWALQSALAAHVLVESVSTFTRTRSYYLDAAFSESVVVADATGKTKQAVSMLGTSLVVFPCGTEWMGTVLLVASLPLSAASLANKWRASSQHEKAVVELCARDFDADFVNRLAALSRARRARVWVAVVDCHDDDDRVVRALAEWGDVVEGVTIGPAKEMGGAAKVFSTPNVVALFGPDAAERRRVLFK